MSKSLVKSKKKTSMGQVMRGWVRSSRLGHGA